jgi:raffinose/stachyose/melibiose transport system substrate-binding protein
MKKKSLAGLICVVIALGLLLSGCSSTTSGTSSVLQSTVSGIPPTAIAGTLQMESGENVGPGLTAFQEIVTNFQQFYPTIKIQLTNLTPTNYDTVMDVKMAADDMPDVYGTAGWATVLYDQFDLNLINEPWVSSFYPNALAVVTNKTGKLEAEPVDQEINELVYNPDVLSKYGVNPDTLTTFSSLVAACKTIYTKSNGSVYGFYIGGADSWPEVVPFNYYSSLAFANGPENTANEQALLNGTFDFTSKWPAYAQTIDELFKYANPDFSTAKAVDGVTALSQGKVAFDFMWMNAVAAKKLNPTLNLSFIPYPAFTSKDKPAFLGGEGSAIAIWNQSKLSDDGRLVLDFFARPDNVELLSEGDGYAPGEKGVTDATFDTAKLATFSSDPTLPIFDREYLPNGEWGVMMTNAGAYLTGQMTAAQYGAVMQQNYTRLYAKAHSSST